jgi:rod shape-determining protein MreB
MHFLSRLPVSLLFRPRINLDLGSRQTRVKIAGGDIVSVPTCLLYHPSSESVIEIGTKAWSSLDKLPPQVDVVFPFRKGVVAYPELAQQYLRAVLQEHRPRQNSGPIIAAKVAAGVPSSITPVERHMLQSVFKAVGLGRVTLIPKTEAIYAGLFTANAAPDQVSILDIGSQVTEIGLFNQGKCVISTSFDFGGDSYTKAVIRLLRDEYQCVIGWITAESIKKQYRALTTSGTSTQKVNDYKIVVRGKGVLSGIPSTVSVSGSLIRDAFALITQELIDEIKTFTAQVPPELLTAALENGLYITGGGSQLLGVSEMVSQELKTHFTLSKTPEEDVIRGVTFINRV